MAIYLSQLFSGISVGSILLLVALGLTFTFGQMNVINMAHGELLMAGAYTTYMIQGAMGRPGQEQEIPEGVLPAGSIGHPRDVANMILYLASDESRFVTGAEFLIDNGLTITPAG